MMCKNEELMILICDAGAVDPMLEFFSEGPAEAKEFALDALQRMAAGMRSSSS